MKRLAPLALTAATLALTACQDSDQILSPNDPADAPAFSIQQQADQVVPGRILARLTDGADAASLGSAHGVAFDRTIASGRIAIFSGAVGNERALAARLGGDDRVVYAEPDYLRQTTAIDPKLWAFHNPGNLFVTFTRGRHKGQIVESYRSVDDADEDNDPAGFAWGGGPVSIASIDTGVQMDHTEFGGATMVPGWDYIDNDSDPSDENDHGTHTTGTMVGDRVGVAGVAGAASKVTVYVYRVCGAHGCPTSAIVSAIYAATDTGVVAMNLSLGGGSLSQSEADAILYATGESVRPGSLVIASAGNGSTSTVSCPACDPNAISVAASDWLDEHAYYTNYGDGLDIIAPGGELYGNTTSEAGIYSSVRGNDYAYFQGTSMSAPQVTGTAAIVTGDRGANLRARLEWTTDDLGAPGYDTQFGWGRLNTHRAVTITPRPTGPAPPPNSPPTASFTHSCSGLECNFTDMSTDSDGSVVAWSWNFGDSGNSTSQNPAHTYSADDTYTVTLTVTDDDGATGMVSQDVTVNSGGGGITLSAVGYKVKGLKKADLTWSGTSASMNVNVFRDGTLIATPANDGFYTDNINERGGGSYEYQVCETDGSTCSNRVTVIF